MARAAMSRSQRSVVGNAEWLSERESGVLFQTRRWNRSVKTKSRSALLVATKNFADET